MKAEQKTENDINASIFYGFDATSLKPTGVMFWTSMSSGSSFEWEHLNRECDLCLHQGRTIHLRKYIKLSNTLWILESLDLLKLALLLISRFVPLHQKVENMFLLNQDVKESN